MKIAKWSAKCLFGLFFCLLGFLVSGAMAGIFPISPIYGKGKFIGSIGTFGGLGYKGYYRPFFYRPYPLKYGFSYGYPFTFVY